jgi:hypothetical protein
MRALPLLLLMACSLEDPCSVGKRRCDADTLQICTGHPGGVSGGGIGDTHYTKGSGPTWDTAAACGTGLCIDSDAGTAFCALDSATCSAPLSCSGTSVEQCNAGHVVERTACAACLLDGGLCDPFLDSTCCPGHQGDSCQSGSDCGAGMGCTNGRCELPCTCAEGARCTSCDVLWNRNAYPDDGAPSKWICTSGLCAVQFQ